MIADILAEDSSGRPLLLAEIKGRVTDQESADRLLSFLEAVEPPIPFGMVADPETIRILKFDCGNPHGFGQTFRTADVLIHYDPQFAKKRILHDYLGTLVEAWLRDLAYHWKSEVPPGTDELTTIGLLPRLEGGTTRSEVVLGGNPLR